MHQRWSFSLQLHRRVAELLRQQPELVERAKQRLDSPVYGTTHAHYVDRWRTLLAGPLDELLQTLVAETDEAQDLRQTSPLTFVLNTRERHEIWKATRHRDPSAA